MRLTIVVDDGAVGIDGVFFFGLTLPQLDSIIHAVQWYGEHGEIEYRTRFENGVVSKPQNQIIFDLTAFQFAIDAWNIAKADAIAAQAAADAEIAAAIAAAEAEAAALVNQQSEPVQNGGI